MIRSAGFRTKGFASADEFLRSDHDARIRDPVFQPLRGDGQALQVPRPQEILFVRALRCFDLATGHVDFPAAGGDQGRFLSRL